jgi:hypothetical protein
MDKALDQAVRSRAGYMCEYCLMPQAASDLRFPLDHIVALQHGGATNLETSRQYAGR